MNHKGKPITGYNRPDGYRCTTINKDKRLDHIRIWENYHNKKLPKNMVIHHKDGNRQNNQINNLMLLTQAEHMNIHRQERADDLEIFSLIHVGLTLNAIRTLLGFKSNSFICYRMDVWNYD